MTQWIEAAVKYERRDEQGKLKKVSDLYLVNAASFTEAEERMHKIMPQYISGPFTVDAVKKSNISEIFKGEPSDDRWYKVKVAMYILDENTNVEKKTNVNMLVQAYDFDGAYKNFLRNMKSTVSDYDIVSIVETKILEVYGEKTEAEK